MSKQEVIISLEGLGEIILSTKNEIVVYQDYLKNSFKIKDNNSNSKYDVRLHNVIEYNHLDDDTPIIVKTNNDFIKHIYLLEETEYILKFKKDNNIKESKNFQILSKITDIKFDTINHEEFFLNFKSYVGKTFLDIKSIDDSINIKIPIEIRSKKINYKNEYQKMIDNLSEITSNLVYNFNQSPFQSPILENHRESTFDYFLILNYIFIDENLPTLYEYLSRNLNKKLETDKEKIPISFASNIGLNEITDIISNPQEIIETNNFEFIKYKNKQYIPLEIEEEKQYDVIDTPENRFYKYFLELLEDLIINLIKNTKEGYMQDELTGYKNEIRYYLSQPYFKEISKLEYIPLNSQILQKKEGYRDLLNYYILLEYGNKIVWDQLNEIILGHQKRLSDIYEIWCCFQLLDIIEKLVDSRHQEFDFSNQTVQNILNNKEKNILINLEENTEFEPFIYEYKDKKVILTLMYNKHFKKGTKKHHSYSIYLRPDYTIQLEYNNRIKYIHFDAKYKSRVIHKETNEKTFKNQDIAKMHTYKDAIPNTICSYVLYPGNYKKKYKKYKHDKYEGVGALPFRPGNKKDKRRIRRFIKQIIRNELMNE